VSEEPSKGLYDRSPGSWCAVALSPGGPSVAVKLVIAWGRL
jgi:hypothetical protein